jgi:mono/diheme cytochrome c family protein
MKPAVHLTLALGLSSLLLHAEEVAEGEKLFALKVKPLFAEKCMACHGDEPDKLKGDFDMRTREAMLLGGETFGKDVLIPGKGEASYLYITTTRTQENYEMPPKEADKLTEEQQWAIRDWINAGAPWPDDERVIYIQQKYAEGEQVATSKALSEDWQNRRYEPQKLWAYRPLKVQAIPDGEHPVDWFVERKLTEAQLTPAPAAEAAVLVRRMSFGLTGLPPTPEVIKEFAASYAKDPQGAVPDFATELMESPHYGEHFGRHWLDVARYADSAGFANDYARPNAWRYRDYVIRAFNEDKPYAEFVRQQVAGDEINPDNTENLIATGFLRMGAWEQTAMSVFKETRQLWLDDVTDSVGQTFLGHALQCAKCHDHKFDPIPTRDYYGMMAVFSTTQFGDRDASFLENESQSGFDEREKWITDKLRYFNKQSGEIGKKISQLKRQETGSANEGDNGLDPGDEASKARINKNIERHKIEKDGVLPIAHSVYTGKTVSKNSVRGRQLIPQFPWGKGMLENDAILTGGSVYSPGDPVKPGALSAAESLGKMKAAAFPNAQGKRRLALAEWIVDESNPLTARVIVNRVWSWHFGKGLAGNPNNLGGTGALPTHPELLDFLADWFSKNNGSIKKLNHLIVSSAAYQRSSLHPDPAEFERLDPAHALYAAFTPRRLSAEELRDAMLAVSGELNPDVGGIPVRPDMNPEVAIQPRQLMGGAASVYEPDPLPKQRNRRSIYAEKNRGLRYPFFETFNQPGPDNSCEKRESSTVAPQALTLFNAEEVQDRALAFAARLLKAKGTDEDIIKLAFELALGREPSKEESEACLSHWKAAEKEEETIRHEPATFPTEIERTVRAEKTGQNYTFTEHLPAYENYVPDLQKSDADARTRGLSLVCLVILNMNEFVYLD